MSNKRLDATRVGISLKYSSMAVAMMSASFLAAAPAYAQSAPISGEITLLGYSGVFQDKYTEAVIKPFEAAHPGVTVKYYTTGNAASMLGAIRSQASAPQTDVVIFDASVGLIGNKEGLFVEMSEKDIPNIADLAPQAIVQKGYGPGVTFDNFVIAYNSEKIKDAPMSVKAFWGKAYAGRISVNSMPNILGTAMTALTAVSEGEDYTKSIDKAVVKLTELAPAIQTFDPKPDQYTLVLNGEVDMAIGWNARSQFYAKSSNGKLKVALPSEGSMLQINSINLVKDAPNLEAAKVFTNYALSPEAQKAFAEAMFYAPVNTKTQLNDEARMRTATDQMGKMIPFDWTWAATVLDGWTQQWRRKIVPAAN